MVMLAGLLTLAVIGGFVYLAENAYNGLPFVSYRTVYASLPNIGHLQQHDPVDIAGVHVGQVLKASTRNNQALIELQLQGVGPLPVNSKVVVRADGLLGERYVDLQPGSSHQMLANGGMIVENNADATYTWGLPETLNLFNAKTRTALGNMINGLGQGVEGRGSQLNQAIHVGANSGANFDTAAYAILHRPGAAKNFLPYTNAGVTALNTARNTIADTFHPAAVTAQTLVTERSPIEHLLSFAPAWESDAVAFGPHGAQLLTALHLLASAGSKVLPVVPRALGSANALLRDTPSALRSAKQVFDAVPAAVPATLSILSDVKPNLKPLKGLFTNLVNPVSSLAEHGCDIQSFATGARSLVSWGTLPGTSYGPDEGFPFSVIAGPGNATNLAGTGLTFPNDTVYHKPCDFAPGVALNNATVLQTLSEAFP